MKERRLLQWGNGPCLAIIEWVSLGLYVVKAKIVVEV